MDALTPISMMLQHQAILIPSPNSSTITNGPSIRPSQTLSSPPLPILKQQQPSESLIIQEKRRISNPPKPVTNYNGYKHFTTHLKYNNRSANSITDITEEVVPLSPVKQKPTVHSSRIFTFTQSILMLYSILLFLSIFSILSAMIILD